MREHILLDNFSTLAINNLFDNITEYQTRGELPAAGSYFKRRAELCKNEFKNKIYNYSSPAIYAELEVIEEKLNAINTSEMGHSSRENLCSEFIDLMQEYRRVCDRCETRCKHALIKAESHRKMIEEKFSELTHKMHNTIKDFLK